MSRPVRHKHRCTTETCQGVASASKFCEACQTAFSRFSGKTGTELRTTIRTALLTIQRAKYILAGGSWRTNKRPAR